MMSTVLPKASKFWRRLAFAAVAGVGIIVGGGNWVCAASAVVGALLALPLAADAVFACSGSETK